MSTERTAKLISPTEPVRSIVTRPLQRKCACARRRTGSCADCRSEQMPFLAVYPLQKRQHTGAGRYSVQTPTSRSSNSAELPNPLRHGLETLSGMDLSQVRVHANSEKPAQVQALAFTQGHEIHLGPGQARHLPHEGWHVVQQMQGRVRANSVSAKLAINNDERLETEADEMGSKALQLGKSSSLNMQRTDSVPLARNSAHADNKHAPIQRFVDCKPVTMSGQICPEREPGEVRASRTSDMVLANVSIETPGVDDKRGGWMIANFAIGSSRAKSDLVKNPLWKSVVSDISKGSNHSHPIRSFELAKTFGKSL